jgi:hypothetical protein
MRLGKNSIWLKPREGMPRGVARELSRNGLPSACIGRYIAVMDEWGVVVFKVPL